MQRKLPDFEALKGLIGEKREKFDRFYAMLLEYNARYNLTSITEEGEVFHKHFLDSLAGVGFFPVGAKCAEVGSGAGFPSIPLAIAREDLSFTLIESTGKKCAFLRAVAEELKLNVKVLCARAEEVGKNPEHREKYDVCVARAVARLNTLSEYCLPLVKRGGIFLAYKGVDEETAEAASALKLLGGSGAECVRYELPAGYGARTLVCVKKERETPLKYPRGRGLERRNPL